MLLGNSTISRKDSTRCAAGPPKGSLSLRNTRPDGYVTLSASGAREATPSALRTSLSGSVRLNQRLPNGLLLNVTADTVLRLGYPVERRLYGYSFDLQGGSAPITWRIVANERFHPDLAKEQATGTPSWMSSGSRPEITVSATPSPTLLGTRIPLTFEVGWGRFSERHAQGVTVDTRATALAQLRTLSLPVSRQLTLSATGYARGYWYGSGSERTVLASTLTATYRPSSNISVRSTYEWLEQIGESPFRFDRTTPRHRVRGSVSYTGDVVSLSASSGYNLLTQAPENLTVSAGIEPLEQVSLRASGVYSLAQHRPVSATAALRNRRRGKVCSAARRELFIRSGAVRQGRGRRAAFPRRLEGRLRGDLRRGAGRVRTGCLHLAARFGLPPDRAVV